MTSFFQIHSAHAITPSESIRLSQQRMSPPGSWLSFPWPATGVVSHQALVIDWRAVEQKLHRTGWEEEESETNQDTAFLENALQYNQLCEIGLQGKHGSGGRRSLAGQVWDWDVMMMGGKRWLIQDQFLWRVFPSMCAVEHYFCPVPQEHRVPWWKPFFRYSKSFLSIKKKIITGSLVFVSLVLWDVGPGPRADPKDGVHGWHSPGSLTLILAVRTKGCLACLPEALQPLLQTDFLWALLSFRNTLLYLNHRSGSSHSQKNRLFPMYEKVNSESKLVHQSFRIWASPPRATNWYIMAKFPGQPTKA